MLDALARLTEYGNDLLATLREAIVSKPVTKFGAVNASGNLAASLRVAVSETATGFQLLLYGASYALALEYGRKPGKFPPLVSIQQWIETRGIVPAPDANGKTIQYKAPEGKDYSSLAFLIARKIANNGSTIYRLGQPTGLFGEVIGENIPAQQLAKVLLPVVMDEVRSAIRLAA
jgi:hypothetical protein